MPAACAAGAPRQGGAGAAGRHSRARYCRYIARIDFRVRDAFPFSSKVPLPGLNPDDSDLVIMAGLVGWSYERLVSTIVNEALRRHHLVRGKG